MANTKKTNPIAVAMRKRHPRLQTMSSKKRTKDYKNSWKKELDAELAEDEHSEQDHNQDVDYDPAWITQDPDYLWNLPHDEHSSPRNSS